MRATAAASFEAWSSRMRLVVPVTTADGRKFLRPCGLTDTPGGASGAGSTAAVLGLCLALRPIGLAVAGPVATAVGTRGTLLGAAAVVVASSLAILAVPSIRGVERAPADAYAREM